MRRNWKIEAEGPHPGYFEKEKEKGKEKELGDCS
jgi:hypothetical protein